MQPWQKLGVGDNIQNDGLRRRKSLPGSIFSVATTDRIARPPAPTQDVPHTCKIGRSVYLGSGSVWVTLIFLPVDIKATGRVIIPRLGQVGERGEKYDLLPNFR